VTCEEFQDLAGALVLGALDQAERAAAEEHLLEREHRGCPEALARATNTAAAESTFAEDQAQLEQRLTLVGAGLAGIGVRAVSLGTEEEIELLYRAFNPGELENPIRLDK